MTENSQQQTRPAGIFHEKFKDTNAVNLMDVSIDYLDKVVEQDTVRPKEEKSSMRSEHIDYMEFF